MISSDPSSGGGLPAGLQELVATMKLDADATIRVDIAGGKADHALSETLPRLTVAPGTGADLEVLELLGQGGMGQVRLARQKALDRDVALKMVSPGKESPQIAGLLLQEGIITGRLEHPNIVPVHLMGVDENDRPIIVMKRVEGVPWSKLDGSDHTTVWSEDPVLRHLEVFLEVCNAVSFAHARGYVHRDIKPANVMIGAFGEVYLLDWGISTKIGTDAFAHVPEEQPGMPLGTPLYMAPEMCREGGVIDELTDVYLLGATLHRLLTGTYRHQGKNLAQVLVAAATSKPFPYAGEIAEELATICNKATARKKGQRYASVTELRQAVMAYLRHKSSIELAHEAEGSLREMERILAEAGAHAEARRLFTECRFAFMRALKDWPENERAAHGIQRCLESMTRLELEVGQLDAAQAWLDEMPERNAELQAQHDELSLLKAADAEQVASLRKLAHELDPTVSKKPRAAFALALALLVVATVTMMSREEPLFAKTPLGALAVMPPFILLYVVGAIAFRKSLFRTLFNRRIMILVGIGIAAMGVNRGVALLAQPSFSYMLGVDLFLIGVIGAVAGATVDKWFYLAAVIWTLGFVGIVALPQFPMLPYAVSQIGGLVVLAYSFYRRGADGQRSSP